jgi:FeS assembly SUF system protein
VARVKIQLDEAIAQDTGVLKSDTPLFERIIHALKGVFDPELPVNVYDLGLIYGLDVSNEGHVHITMTLTAPNCPVADQIPRDIAAAVQAVEGVVDVDVKLVWEPKWTKDKMSDAAKIELGLF